MDRTLFYQNRVQEIEREISRELTVRRLLGGAKGKSLPEKRAIRLALRVAPVAITLSILLILTLLVL
jgi:hypothetical protein